MNTRMLFGVVAGIFLSGYLAVICGKKECQDKANQSSSACKSKAASNQTDCSEECEKHWGKNKASNCFMRCGVEALSQINKCDATLAQDKLRCLTK